MDQVTINADLASLPREAQIAWLAGLFDADGTLLSAGRSKQRTYISIEMTDLDILVQCHHLFGGKLYGPYHKNSGFNVLPMFQWRSQRQADTWDLLDAIFPFLSARRQAKIEACRMQRADFVDARFK